MAARKLKVFRTAIGFHDAYVAAPSKKAALAAWGSDHDLFASGRAEIVTDAKLAAAPLAEPGKVIRLTRGSAEEHLSALAKSGPRPARRASKAADSAPPRRRAKPKPRPGRTALDKAEAALERAECDRARAMAELSEEQSRLDKRRKAAEAEHRRAIERLRDARDRHEERYDTALARWREDG